MVIHTYEDLLRALISWRESKGWSQSELASRIGRRQSTIGNYEAGANKVSVERLIELLDVFGLELVVRDSTGAGGDRLAEAMVALNEPELQELAAVAERLAPHGDPVVRQVARKLLRAIVVDDPALDTPASAGGVE